MSLTCWQSTVLGLITLCGATACDSLPASFVSEKPLPERIRMAVTPALDLISSEARLRGVRRVPVAGTEKDTDGVFFVTARKPELWQYPCSECHGGESSPEGVRGHASIRLDHAGEQTMTCATCHSTEGRNSLSSLQGHEIGFDQSHEVCAQCHMQQERDWRGGSHGKRLGGWADPRVVLGCPACHDPHRPRLEPRWPSYANRPLPTPLH